VVGIDEDDGIGAMIETKVLTTIEMNYDDLSAPQSVPQQNSDRLQDTIFSLIDFFIRAKCNVPSRLILSR